MTVEEELAEIFARVPDYTPTAKEKQPELPATCYECEGTSGKVATVLDLSKHRRGSGLLCKPCAKAKYSA